jgi:hypothetical protein
VDIEQDQPGKPRQDVKHVAMLALCVPHFLDDVRAEVADETEQKQTLANYVRALAAMKHNYSARHFEARHPGVIGWPELIPQRIQQMAFEREVREALRQITGASQSRGMRI